MILKRYAEISAFAERVKDCLLEWESLNNIPLGNINRALKGGDTAGWFCATVEDDTACSDSPLLIALRNPPYSMQLYAPRGINGDALRLLLSEYTDVPGIIAEKQTADAFLSLSGRTVAHRMDMNLMELTRLRCLAPTDGLLRLYNSSDFSYLPRWQLGFVEDCRLDDDIGGEDEIRARLTEGIGKNELYIFEAGGNAVSMAKAARQMEHGIVVNSVYTPPELRGKGYSQSCVYRLSKLLLERGNRFVCLFADKNNPVSNHVYQKIGFRDVCDYSDIRFAPEA